MIKRVAAVLSAAGFLAVALFSTNLLAAEQTADTTVVSVTSTTSDASVSVSAVEPTLTMTLGSATELATLAGRWGAERIAVASAWNAADDFGPVTVAVLDTGISPDTSFADRIVGNVDFTGEGLQDEHGHGTHMAGTIAAIAPNASLLNVKVADSRGRCETADVANGIRWAADHGAQVINISLEVAASADLENAVSHAWASGAVVVVAAGNSGTTAPAYPAAYPEALAVAGTSQSDGLTVLSNHGDWVDIAAPGSKIYAEMPGSEFGYETGTSPAAAHVSGVAALLCGIAQDVSGNGLVNDEVRNALETSTSPLAVAGTGSGIVNALAAVTAVAA